MTFYDELILLASVQVKLYTDHLLGFPQVMKLCDSIVCFVIFITDRQLETKLALTQVWKLIEAKHLLILLLSLLHLISLAVSAVALVRAIGLTSVRWSVQRLYFLVYSFTTRAL